MSTEGEQVPAAEVKAEEAAPVEPVVQLDPTTALKIVLTNALYDFEGGLHRGLHEAVKCLDRGQGKLCVLCKGLSIHALLYCHLDICMLLFFFFPVLCIVVT